MISKKELFDLALWATLASAGGLARFLESRLSITAEPVTLKRFMFLLFANVFVSGFSGLMGALMMSTITTTPTWNFIAAGVFGFLGAKGVDILAEKLNEKL